MTAWTLSLLPGASTIIGLVLKATLVLGTGAAAALLARRASAAARHAVWAATLAALVALPLLSAVLPGWSIPLPDDLTAIGIDASDRSLPTVGFGSPDDIRPRSTADDRASSLAIPPTQIPAAVWLAGTLAGLMGIAGGAIVRLTLRRRSTPVTDGAWAASLREVAGEMGIARRVALLRSAEWGIPATWGVLRPVILLPAACDEWDGERRRTLLLHELAHVRRGDAGVRLMAEVARALFWFHPLAWHAARRLVAEQERACDDAVLRAGTAPHAYAAALLSIAHDFRAAPLALAGAAMARASQLEGRILSILDPERRRAPLPRPARAAIACATLASAAVIASLTSAGAAAAPRLASSDRTTAAPDSGRLKIDWREGGAEMMAIVRGDVRFGGGVGGVAVPRGGLLLIEETTPAGPGRRFEVTADGQTWSVGTRPTPLDSEARAWLGPILDYVRETTVFAAESRRPAPVLGAFVAGNARDPNHVVLSAAPRDDRLRRRIDDVVARREAVLEASEAPGLTPLERLALERRSVALGWEELRLMEEERARARRP
jgi:beta-lactamase regulating signal transducer with metallopeptidase domain